MSTVLDRKALEGSPLADLHVIANEIGVDGFRRLRKADLVDAIVARQSGAAAAAGVEADADVPSDADAAAAVPGAAEVPGAADADAAPADDEAPKRRTRRRTRKAADEETTAAVEAADRADADEAEEPRPGRRRSRRGRRDEEVEAGEEPAAAKDAPAAKEDRVVEGVVELQPNGSGFVRADPAQPSDDDVYVSAAQVKRCELVSGDRIGGPVRPPRRSERYPSLIRVDTINGRPAEEVAEGTRFEDLPAGFPTERFQLGSPDPTVTAVEWLTPFGKGSRVVVTGGPLSGKSDLLRRIAGALTGREGLDLTVVLAGARPEEVGEWGEGIRPTAAAALGASPELQAQVVEQAVELGRRVAARGGDAVVVIDALDQVSPGTARRAMAAARNIVDGGSLTVIAAASSPLGGETTVITLDGALTGLRRFPNIDLPASATMRPELLVGEEGAEKIAVARAEASSSR